MSCHSWVVLNFILFIASPPANPYELSLDQYFYIALLGPCIFWLIFICILRFRLDQFIKRECLKRSGCLNVDKQSVIRKGEDANGTVQTD